MSASCTDLKSASDDYRKRTAQFHLNYKPAWLESLDKHMKLFFLYIAVVCVGACTILLIWG